MELEFRNQMPGRQMIATVSQFGARGQLRNSPDALEFPRYRARHRRVVSPHVGKRDLHSAHCPRYFPAISARGRKFSAVGAVLGERDAEKLKYLGLERAEVGFEYA